MRAGRARRGVRGLRGGSGPGGPRRRLCVRAGAASGPNFPFVAVRGSAAVVKRGAGGAAALLAGGRNPGSSGRAALRSARPFAWRRAAGPQGARGLRLRAGPSGTRAGEEELAAVRRVGAVKEPGLPGGGFVAPMRGDRGCSGRSDTTLPTLVFPSSFCPWISEASREKGALKVAAIRGWHGLRCCASSVCPSGRSLAGDGRARGALRSAEIRVEFSCCASRDRC